MGEIAGDLDLIKGAKISGTSSGKKASKSTVKLWGCIFLFDWLYLWVWRLIVVLRYKDIKDVALELNSSEKARDNAEKMCDAWENEVVTSKGLGRKPSLLRAIWSVYGVVYGLLGIWKLVWAAFTWLGAYYFLKLSLNWITANAVTNGPANDSDLLAGHMYAVALLLCGIFSSIAIHQLYGLCSRMEIRVRSGLCGLIFRKTLVLARIKGGAGEVMNLVNADVSRICDAITNFHFLWSAFIEAILILVLVAVEIKEAFVPSLLLVLLLLPVQWMLGSLNNKIQEQSTALTTERVHLSSEVLTAVKLIKFYAWEKPFSQRLTEIREEELRLVKKNMKVKAINFAIVFIIPVIASLLCLTWYWSTSPNHTLNATTVFVVLSLLNTLRYPFLMLPMAVTSTAGASISLVRIANYLTQNELTPILPEAAPEANRTLAFNIQGANFTWEGEAEPTLYDLNISLNRGEILAVIGDVGSGKSSFVAALLGQIKITKGDIKIHGTTSYVPQEAWLLNCKLKDNILFGSTFDRKKYDEVVYVCALQRDLTLLAAGDETEIGERGSNLSGGQKQRVSLSRAVYNDPDIVLLDDPLSAVDQNVGRHIFEKCVKTYLQKERNKAVVLVTHQLQYLEQCDKVAVLKQGRIVKYGTFKELYTSDESFKSMIENHVASGENGDDVEDFPLDSSTEEEESPKATVAEVIAANAATVPAKRNFELNQLTVGDRNQLTVRSMRYFEKLNDKHVSSIVERHQLDVLNSSSGYGSHDVAKVIERNQMSVLSTVDKAKSSSLAAAAKEIASNANEPQEEQREISGKLIQEDTSADRIGFQNFAEYSRAGSGTAVTIFVIVMFFVVHGIRIGSDYWLRCWVPNTLNTTAAVYLGVYTVFVVVFGIGVLSRGLLFSTVSNYKARTLHANMLTRIMRAPQAFFDTTPLARILSSFSKHQYQVDNVMPDNLMQMLQYMPLALGAMILISCIVKLNYAAVWGTAVIMALFVWFSARAEKKLKQMEAITKPPVFSHLTATLEGLFSIRAYHAEKRFDDMNLEKLDTNHESLYAQYMAKTWVALYIDLLTSLMIYFTALLLVVYRDDIPQPASTAGLALSNALQMLVFVQWTVRMLGDVNAQMSSVGQLSFYGSEAVPEEAPRVVPDCRPANDWPATGCIEFRDIVLRYQKFGVDVLKKVSFKINAREKIGIVGRTGSGKSTLLISLLRIVEAAEGQVFIDGLDVKTIGLDDLRTRIAIIPQEPVLFVGTVRSNLDPFHRSTDDEIWKALDAVHLSERIRGYPSKLETPVIENGKNFSLGQRQLFCIARAILSKTRILVLDEASSALDMETDQLIQETIKTAFVDLTVLTIAHRLNTIIEADKILLMDGGKLIEFEEPIKLLDDKQSSFYNLVSQTGPAASKKLYDLAKAAHDERQAKSTSA